MKKILSFFSNLILLALSVYTIHDMQSAQGIGYYFCLKAGSANRLPFDIAVDVVFCLLFALLLALPVIFGKSSNFDSLSRFLIIFIAFVPTISTNYVFSLFFNTAVYSRKLNFIEWLGDVIAAYGLLIPMTILVIGYYCEIRGNSLSHQCRAALIAAILLIIPGLIVPAITTLCIFLGVYIILCVVFDLLEKTNFNSLWIYAFLFAVAVFRLLSVTAAWGIN